MIVFPNAKINLGLNILYKRDDGFHEIDSIFYPIEGLRDVLEIIESNHFQFTSSGLYIPGDEQQNLCVKAYHLLKKDYDLPPVKMHLHKVIPMGAGLGGGSADGAFTINLLNDLFDLGISEQKRMEYAAQLGSDCAFFIKNEPAHATGRGELLKSINLELKDYQIALINPGIHVGTKEAYAGITPNREQISTEAVVKKPLLEWKNELTNAFEQSVFKLHQEIEGLKQQLYNNGAIYASMTGSGSTVFGLFEKSIDLTGVNPNYFIWTGRL